MVPVFDGERVIAVFDIDSDHKDWFTDTDKLYLERIVSYITK